MTRTVTLAVCLTATLAVASPTIAATEPECRVVEVARLDGYEIAQGDPWSPRGSLLALENGTQLAIWDASRPTAAPRVLIAAQVDEVRWSPDARWLCCRVRVANATRGGAVRLQFVALADGANEYRIPNAAIGPWTWADDGFVYFWNGQSGERKRVDPPRAWRAQWTPPVWSETEAAQYAQLVLRPTTERGRRTRSVLFTPQAGETPASEVVLDSISAGGGVQPWCRVRSPAHEAPTWIVAFQTRTGTVTTHVVDVAGRKRALLDSGTQFSDWTVRPDGRWVLGAACTRPRDGSAPECTTRAFATDGSRSVLVPQLNGASRVQHDPVSNLVAVGMNATRNIRIVRLDIAPAKSSAQ